jgi:Domain of unknown function (DUF4258)
MPRRLLYGTKPVGGGGSLNRLKYTDHSEDRLQQRRIGKNQIQQTIDNPDHVEVQSNGRLKATRQTSEGSTIVVIYEDHLDGDGACKLIITAMRR